MKQRVLVYLAPGFEEIEAVTIVDLLRRAEINVTVAGLEKGNIKGSHGITLTPDSYYKDINFHEFDILVLPGGQPGTTNLKNNPHVLAAVKSFYTDKKILAAICAAPLVFAEAGITQNKRITSYPSEKGVFSDANYIEETVVRDGNLWTSRGVGTAIEFTLELIAAIRGEKIKEEISRKILWS